jgi:hypothetical protein
MYTDCIQTFEREAATLREQNAEKDSTIYGLVQASDASNSKLILMEMHLEKLVKDLSEEQSRSNDYFEELSKMKEEYNEDLDSLRNETQSYQRQISQTQEQVEALKQHKKSMTDELERSETALEEKSTCIAILDQELAEKLNELYATNKSLEEEKERSKALEGELQVLKQSVTPTTESSAELARLTKLYEEASLAENKSKYVLLGYESKMQFMTHQLLLSNQSIYKKQAEITQLKQQLDSAKSNSLENSSDDGLISDLKASLSDMAESSRQIQAKANEKLVLKNRSLKEQEETITELNAKIKSLQQTEKKETQASNKNDEALVKENGATVANLKMALDELLTKSGVSKAEADQKMMFTQQLLQSKEKEIVALQAKIDGLINETKDAIPQTISTANNEVESEVSKLKLALGESQSKFKEKLLVKNQCIKEKDDSIEQLTTEMSDLQREKEHIEEKWMEEIRRNEGVIQSHDLQLHAMEDKLRREHASNIASLESEMNETVYQLEFEIQSLKRTIEEESVIRQESPILPPDNKQIQEMEETIAKMKDNEVSLIKQNILMKNRVQMLQEAQQRSSLREILDESDNSNEQRRGREAVGSLPSYYKAKESKRARVVRVVRDTWRKVFRRKKF